MYHPGKHPLAFLAAITFLGVPLLLRRRRRRRVRVARARIAQSDLNITGGMAVAIFLIFASLATAAVMAWNLLLSWLLG